MIIMMKLIKILMEMKFIVMRVIKVNMNMNMVFVTNVIIIEDPSSRTKVMFMKAMKNL